jgi:hypothetical protein
MTPSVSTFPFIVGVGRSGTTLLRTMLDAHPDIAVAHESRFVGYMARHPSRYERDGRFDIDRFVSDLLDPGSPVPSRVNAWGLAPDEIRRAVIGTDPPDLAAAIRAVYRRYAAHHGATRYADKTPGYVDSVTEVGRLFPEATFVHLVRDGRDVALSMLEVDFGGVNVPHAAWLWKRRVRAAERAGAVLGPSRYLVVRYEELIQDPEATLHVVCAHLGLPFDGAMLRYVDAPDRITRELVGQEHHRSVQLPVTAGLRAWRTQMAPHDLAQFEHIAGDLLAELGYELATPHSVGHGDELATLVRVSKGRAVAAWRARQRVRRRRTDSPAVSARTVQHSRRH